MEKETKAIPDQEPFKPQDTPKPPQNVEPSKRKKASDDKPRGDGHAHDDKPSAGRPHLLNEEADIDDETTL